MGAAITAAVYGSDTPEDADLFSLSAHALAYLAMKQCFADGNKRAAWGTFVRILDMNGMRIVADQVEAAELTLAVAGKKRDALSVVSWLLEPGRIVAAPAT
jgi:death-on-curing protein